ncbi:hypothetical protein CRYUN_Cryun09bG0217800 [Craigia yunnanensis]
MASTACILNHHAFNLAPTISRSSSSQRQRSNIKASKLVCRAQTKPLSNGDQVQGGVSRRSVLDGIIVGSAAIGSALVAFVGGAYGDDFSLGQSKPLCKQSWPELVGEKGKVAVATIEKENPYVKAIVLLEGTPTDRMYNITRVRVFVDKKDVVTEVPRAG